MVSEPGHTRQRASSNASAGARNGTHARTESKAAVQPKSSHTSDEFLQDFLNPSFDAAAYLNGKLPPLAPRQASTHASSRAVPLAELSAQAQTLLSQVNAQTTRLSNTLTQLADDILRSGSRLAYEVELLRGETVSLSETLHDGLQEDVKVFVPGGLDASDETGKKETKDTEETADGDADANDTDAAKAGANTNDPEYIRQLQTLTIVRARLESVIKTFGDAMDFAFPPSEVSVSSSFLSVSAPDPSGSDQQSSEDKGQQVLRKLRDEISNLLSRSDDPVQGIEKAANRIEELKTLTGVWKGTAEEKGRNKFIESLAKMVEDRHRDLLNQMEQRDRRQGKPGATNASGNESQARRGGPEEQKSLPGGFGLINQLQKLRSGL